MKETMNKKITKATICLMLGLTLFATGCGKKKKKADTSTTTEATTVTTTEEVTTGTTTEEKTTEATTEADKHKGLVQSDLTGEWVKPEEAAKRPVGVMINNIDISWPQSGVSKADVIYEMTCEGGITRFLALFTDYSGLDKIGSIRSARQYFVVKALEHDAILAHVGGSTYGLSAIKDYGVDDIEGLYESVFYRSDDRYAPHNCYLSADGINESIADHGYRTEHDSSYKSTFSFNEEDKDLEKGEKCTFLDVRYNSFTEPYYEYDEKTKVYSRSEYGMEHVDDQTNTQLTFKNVLIVITSVSGMPDGKYNDVTLNGSGSGYYATNGKIIPITWKKDGDYSVTEYFTEDGKPLLLNPGKTFVQYFDEEDVSGIQWE